MCSALSIKRVREGMPKLPNDVILCTFYLYPSAKHAEEGRNVGGTGFIVGVPSELHPDQYFTYGVTNWHVACSEGCSVVRVFTKDGRTAILNFGPEDWQFIAGKDDIAAIEIDAGSLNLNTKFLSTEMFVTRQHLEREDITIGEDVFMIGRFMDHDGGLLNVPAARFGHISMLPHGKILTPNGARRESFCVDMHSRTGYSGSPVFVYRTPGSDFTTQGLNFGNRMLMLLGIHWGHFPELWEITEAEVNPRHVREASLVMDRRFVKGLSGMTCVAPAWGIQELLDIPKFADRRKVIDENLRVQIARSDPSKPSAE